MEFSSVKNPLDVIEIWMKEAAAAGAPMSEAMTLATVGEDGRPAARIVLFKGREGDSIHFFTNYESQKGRELARHPYATLVFYFAAQQKQARIDGAVRRVSVEESEAYFATRPRESQIGAWVSLQSQPLSSREELESRRQEFEVRFSGGPVPRPTHWGGYAVAAEKVELWVGQVARLHDRALFVPNSSGEWKHQLLFP